MKVLHITNNYPTKNHKIFGIFVKEQVDALQELGVNNRVIFFNTREKGKIEYLKGMFKVFFHLFSNKYDVIHCHHAYSALITIFAFSSIFSKKVVSYQGSPDIEGKFFLFKIINYFFDDIIFKAEFSKYCSNKTHYLPNGVNVNFFRPMIKEEAKNITNLNYDIDYLLFMDSYQGRPYKRYDRFKKVIELLNTEYGYNNIKELILTNTKRDLIPYFINSSSVHVLTSDTEGSPNSVKECMACNIPIVSTPVGNVRKMLVNVNNSYVSDSFDVSNIAYLTDQVLKSKRKNNGREIINLLNLDSKSVAKELIKIYSKHHEK
jgi:teichuronic acid biosynthesis glycosyltransferase TuaC